MEGTLESYRTQDTLGKSPLDLVIKVYDGAIEQYRKAAEAFDAGEPESAVETLDKAKKFIVHLYTTLDPEKGGEVAENLANLYVWSINRTNLAAAAKEKAGIDDIITVLENLRGGWSELKTQGAPASPERPTTPTATPGSFSTSG